MISRADLRQGRWLCAILAITALPVFGCVEAAPRALQPRPRKAGWWTVAHGELLKRVSTKKHARLVFLGDSLVQRWAHEGKGVWKQRYAALGALNLGLSGDRTEHLLWRLGQGAMRGLCPRVAVLQIGTNNLYRDRAETIAVAVTAVAQRVASACGRTRVLVLGLFPRGPTARSGLRAKLRRVNRSLAGKLAKKARISFLDIGDLFLDSQGRISPKIMWDFLHLTTEGYERWARGMAPSLKQMLSP